MSPMHIEESIPAVLYMQVCFMPCTANHPKALQVNVWNFVCPKYIPQHFLPQAWKQWLSVSRALTKADGESATAQKTAQAFPNLLASRSGNTCFTILASRGLGPINGCCREKRLCLIGSVVPSLRPLFACLQKVQGLMLDGDAVFTFLKMKSLFCLKQSAIRSTGSKQRDLF